MYSDIEVNLKHVLGTDLTVVNAARVSFAKESEWEWGSYDDYKKDPDNWHYNATLKSNESEELCPTGNFRRLKRSKEWNDAGLIKYLAEKGHWSPFSHCTLQFHIKAPIFVARQLVKHRIGGEWNEISRRYVDDDSFKITFYKPDAWRERDKNKKQGSKDTSIPQEYLANSTFDDFMNQALDIYKKLIDFHVAPEQARMILPQNTMTEWIWTGSLYFFARVCNLRLEKTAQYETRLVAQQISDDCQRMFPESWKHLVKNNKREECNTEE